MTYQPDIFRIIVRKSDREKCLLENQLPLGVSSTVLDDDHLEYTIELNRVAQAVYLRTDPECELILKRLSREIGLDSPENQQTRNRMQNDMIRREKMPSMSSSSTMIKWPGERVYIQTLSDLPALYLSSYDLGRAKFETLALQSYIMPANQQFELYTVVDHQSVLASQIKMVFESTDPNCHVISYHDQTIYRSRRSGFLIEKKEDGRFLIRINRKNLFKRFPIGTVFSILPSCDLKPIRLTRTGRIRVSRHDNPQIKLDLPDY